MRLWGTVKKDGKLWLVEIPILDAMTQGRTRKEALAMAADMVETLVGSADFEVTVHAAKHGEIEIEGSNTRKMIALLLKRQREGSGLSLAEVARRLNAKSRNAYARYERGEATPTVETLAKLLAVVSGGRDLVLRQSAAA